MNRLHPNVVVPHVTTANACGVSEPSNPSNAMFVSESACTHAAKAVHSASFISSPAAHVKVCAAGASTLYTSGHGGGAAGGGGTAGGGTAGGGTAGGGTKGGGGNAGGGGG